MGRVYLARSPGGRMVAVKVIRSALAEDAGFRHRFAREVASARKVGGLFTAQVVDADVDGPVPWLVTAYVPGRPLSDAVDQQGPLPAQSVLALAAGLAEGLIAIHAAGVIHRDLKPSNVLLAQDGPRIIDFGISSAADATQLTGTGFMIGSPGFMSPEQAEGLTVGPASDIFSLGCVLTFAAKGEGPFGTGDTAALLYRIVHGKPNLDQIPDKLRPLIKRSLSRDAKRRPTAAQFLADLSAAVPSAADLTNWLPPSVLDPSGQPHPAGAAGTGAPGLAGTGAAGPPDLMAPSPTGVSGPADAMAAAADAGGGNMAGPPTRTTKTPTPPPQYPQQYRSQDYPAPQGYQGLSAGSGSQGGPGAQGSVDNPWWVAQQSASTPRTPPPMQDLPSPYGPPPGSMAPPDQYSPVPGSVGPSGQYSPVPGSMGPPDQYSPVPAPAPRPRRKRPPWLLPVAIGAAVAGAVIAALVLSLSPHSPSGSSGTSGGGTRGGASPRPTPTVGNLSVAQLQVGDCLTGANLQLDNKNAPWPNLALAVPCNQPHTAEVFYANQNYWAKNSPYPGDATIASASDTACSNAFAAYVGTSLNQSVYSVIKLVPVADSWQRKNDRALHCVAYEPTRSHPGGVNLNSSIKGSAK
jgi:hypothetical protein